MSRSQALLAAAFFYTVCVYGTMATMSIGAGLVFVSWLVARGGQWGADLKLMRASPVFAPSVALAVTCLWSLVWAKYSGLGFYGAKPTVSWDDTRKVWHLAFTFVLFGVFANLSDTGLRKVAKAWIALGVASAAVGIVQHWVPFFEPMQIPNTMHPDYVPPLGILSGKYHATGFTGFHLSYAAILGFPASVILAMTLVLVRREGMSRRAALAVSAFALCFVANMLTFSKVAWVALPLTVILFAYLVLKGRLRYIAVGAVVVCCVGWFLTGDARSRFADNHARSIIERELVWGANFAMIREHPVFGVGWHRNSELSAAYYEKKHVEIGFESHAHNNVIDQLATTGIVGLIPFLWLNILLVVLALRLYRGSHDLLWRTMGLGLVGGWFCLHINGLTQSNWWDAKVLHQISWVTALTMECARRYRAGK